MEEQQPKLEDLEKRMKRLEGLKAVKTTPLLTIEVGIEATQKAAGAGCWGAGICGEASLFFRHREWRRPKMS
jgi:hypothetical protein